MKSVKQVTKEYNRMLTLEEHSSKNRKNSYTCTNCNYETISIDLDSGTTPFIIECSKCKQQSYSSFYDTSNKDKEPEIEWYRPTLKKTLKFRKQESLLEHILQGGLLMRNIK